MEERPRWRKRSTMAEGGGHSTRAAGCASDPAGKSAVRATRDASVMPFRVPLEAQGGGQVLDRIVERGRVFGHRDLEERVERPVRVRRVRHRRGRRADLGEPFGHRGVGQLAGAGEEVIVVLAREMPPLALERDANLQGLPRAEADPRVHDEVLAHALGEDDLVAERAKDLETSGDERLFELLRSVLGHAASPRPECTASVEYPRKGATPSRSVLHWPHSTPWGPPRSHAPPCGKVSSAGADARM